MATMREIEQPSDVLFDDDEGIEEALRRDAELNANPTQAISLSQLDNEIQSRRG